MIPKIIHYAWFGKKELPPMAMKCIESWKKICPDYKIIRWDESNYDYNKHPYTKEAYRNGKYAFVVDYLRLDVLYQFGGIFFDTDVELIKSVEPLLSYPAFAGFECGEYHNFMVALGLGAGAEAGNPVIKAMLDDYAEKSFLDSRGNLNLTPCPAYQTNVLKNLGLKLENKQQNLDYITIFPTDYFCPVNYSTGKISITSHTYSIHHYLATWMPAYRRGWHFLTQKFSFLRKADKIRKKIQGKDPKI